MQDRLEFIGEGVVTAQQGFAASSKTVVSDNGWNGSEQTDRGGNQCLSDAWGNSGQGRLLGTRQTAEGVHDAPDRTEQADVRAHGTDGGQEWQALLKLFFFAGNGNAHGTRHAFHDRFRINA
ncbi:hypothetical protein D3C86_1393640 [compost metagenome]